MEAWQIVLISVAVPALITAGMPYLSGRLKARQEARHSDFEIGARLRDELWTRNEALTVRVGVLEAENAALRTQLGTVNYRVTRLEAALRRHGHENEIDQIGGGAA